MPRDFRRLDLALDKSRWSSGGVSMTPWSPDLALFPLREVWIRCLGVPLHSRCSSTFLSIGRQWGDVISIDFSSLDYGSMEDVRILLLIDVVASLNMGFILKVSGSFREDCRSHGSTRDAGASMEALDEETRSPHLTERVNEPWGLQVNEPPVILGPGLDEKGFCVVFDGNASEVPSIDLYVDLGGASPMKMVLVVLVRRWQYSLELDGEAEDGAD
ncbi:hypothetical protein Dimus_005668 [Dionaea muscipula]